ncbi:NosR/NirI family protein [Cohaesibacter celericrescens]|uniref:Regulatory protein NosR n=1 Tax=Cohaesibacter celericrescens TaxID=2067669 RepID=A0A2N5XUH8_9HYPH|nr:NosR/NirI family protein [Cohaesibacter celericrescens]PLW78130.1 regulatory protein NosR [Cohaesibacter celericrescens]
MALGKRLFPEFWRTLAPLLVLLAATLLLTLPASALGNQPVIEKYLTKVAAADLVEGATDYGPLRSDVPIAPVMKNDELLGYAFITSDFVSTTGYSGKPIHVMVAIDPDGKLLKANLVKHSEPIVLIGIPNSKIQALTETYSGLDIVHEAKTGGSGHDLDIISGATVTIMIIDDSIVRSAIKVSRAMQLGGLTVEAGSDTPPRALKSDLITVSDWQTLSGDGSIRRMTLDIGQVNSAFEKAGDARAIKRPEPGDPTDTYIDMQAALVSVPSIGLSLLGDAEYKNLTEWLKEGEQAILIMGRGVYSFKGSGYVRGGIFDRIQLIQGDNSVRFHDRQQKRLGALAPDDAPAFNELDIFKIPADADFDVGDPWRLQLLVNRAVGPIEKTFLTFDLGYKLPEFYLEPRPVAPLATSVVDGDEDAAARAALWKRVWNDKKVEIAILLVMLTVLTGTFFFQKQATRNAKAFYWFRMGFLTLTLAFLGWSQNAQLSIVNLMALGASFSDGFSWDAFLLDPLVFILWSSVAAALLFWGRGAFCGWLCPFGALQELSNQIARFFKVPQITLPWGLHERLWPLKYMIFMGLVGLSMVSVPLAEQYAEIEPFKTAIILKFARGWPYVLFAVALLSAGLFIERFYCRYLCPLGAALAIPGRIRMFDWLKRYKECGSPCQTCANECFVQAIHPTGEINPNECLSCLHCQVLYQDDQKCPVCIKQRKSREKIARSNATSADAFSQLLGQPSAKN